jgi:hypothetical protein
MVREGCARDPALHVQALSYGVARQCDHPGEAPQLDLRVKLGEKTSGAQKFLGVCSPLDRRPLSESRDCFASRQRASERE